MAPAGYGSMMSISRTSLNKRGSHLRRGWCWGKQAFAAKLLKLGEAATGRKREARGYDASLKMTAHGEQQAPALLEEGLRVANLAKEKLVGVGCTEPRKVFIPRLLWKKTRSPKRGSWSIWA